MQRKEKTKEEEEEEKKTQPCVCKKIGVFSSFVLYLLDRIDFLSSRYFKNK